MAEATTKKKQNIDGYSKENKGEKEAKYTSVRSVLLCWKGAGHDKKNTNMGFLKVQEIFGTNLFFWMVFRREKSDAVPRTEEDNNCERVQGGKSQSLPRVTHRSTQHPSYTIHFSFSR